MVEFPFHAPHTAPEAARPMLEATEKSMGFIPNIFRVMAEEPALLEAYKAMAGFFAKSGLSLLERNVVWLEANVQNDCVYCVPAHTAIAKKAKVPDDVIEALRNETPIADEKLEALRLFTRKMVLQRGEVSEADLEAFFAVGYDRRAVLAVILGIAHKVMSNYTNHVATTPADEAYSEFAWERSR